MKVYVVSKEMDYGVHWIRGVFSSESLAEEFIEKRKQGEDQWHIEEWEVDGIREWVGDQWVYVEEEKGGKEK